MISSSFLIIIPIMTQRLEGKMFLMLWGQQPPCVPLSSAPAFALNLNVYFLKSSKPYQISHLETFPVL